ncbi:hypothetical protein GCM10023322_11240 [Rugosimonospora acidiphila]|uniref:Gram-positive cocci surface proteins LPxTG domain-containing protein n=1 Tax=Rugosimonospora acidiphila TaxID=556531 RepID=A0ABP9RL77_9ACTN
MRIARIISALAGALAIVAAPAVAHAQNEYPPTGPSLTLSSTTINEGATVTLTGQNFTPNDPGQITGTRRPVAAGAPGTTSHHSNGNGAGWTTVAYKMPLADDGAQVLPMTTTVRADGTFSVLLRFNDPGVFDISAADAHNLGASVTLTVLATNLPVTGDSLTPWGIGGGALLVAGAGLYLIARRRRQRADGDPGAPQLAG